MPRMRPEGVAVLPQPDVTPAQEVQRGVMVRTRTGYGMTMHV